MSSLEYMRGEKKIEDLTYSIYDDKNRKNRVPISITIDINLCNRLSEYCKQNHKIKSRLIEQIIVRFLEENGKA